MSGFRSCWGQCPRRAPLGAGLLEDEGDVLAAGGFVLHERLGYGSMGRVVRATRDGQSYAVKVVNKAVLDQRRIIPGPGEVPNRTHPGTHHVLIEKGSKNGHVSIPDARAQRS